MDRYVAAPIMPPLTTADLGLDAINSLGFARQIDHCTPFSEQIYLWEY
jgi:hypothetical protein